MPSGENFVDIAVGKDFACALDESGRVACWGALEPPDPSIRFTEISASHGRACGVEHGGAVRCWGDPFEWLRFTYAPPKGEFVDVTVGNKHACARKKSGDTECWGVNQQGQVSGSPPSMLYRN